MLTSFYHPTLPDWENREPSLLFRAPQDENLRSALVDALDLSQSLCTNAGHERLLGLLGGGNGGTVEALSIALVGVIESNDRRVGPICELAARTLTFSPSAALDAVRAARRAGIEAIVARLEHTVVNLTIHTAVVFCPSLRMRCALSRATHRHCTQSTAACAPSPTNAFGAQSMSATIWRRLETMPGGCFCQWAGPRTSLGCRAPLAETPSPRDDRGTATLAHAGFRCIAASHAPRPISTTTALRTSAVLACSLTRFMEAWPSCC